MTLSTEDWEALKAEDGYIIFLDGEQVPVGLGFDYEHLYEVFNDLIDTRGVEKTAKVLGYKDGKDMVLDLADLLENDYTIDDLVLDSCDGHAVADLDYEADAADHKADELAGR